ncbi:class I SAM-dependent rRNA methyltransferase [Labilithrix luteola]|nr:class I SAM-dependent rRNA methyltransferase [Labilithrix luteola]
MADVIVSRQGMDSARHGHPWLYRASIDHFSSSPERLGSIVRLVSEQGEPFGCGILDPNSPIAVRVWGLGPDARLDADVFRTRVERALAVRKVLFSDGRTTAYRLLNGEGDRVPGFVLDRYDDVAVLKIDGDAAKALAPTLTRDLEKVLRDAGITTLLERESGRTAARSDSDASTKSEAKRIHVRFGPEREKVQVLEHGVPWVVDLIRGQKTGAFLDQRENRRRVGELVARRLHAGLGARVLNLFSYTGGFSLRAALAGGKVTSLDIAAQAHATAQESFKLAGVAPKDHEFVAADAFAWLADAKRKGRTWDVVISDPPSFAPSEKAKPKAISAYRALHRACVEVLAPGGHFVAASCSSHVGAEEFLHTLDDAALGHNDLRLCSFYGPPDDHPTLPSFPEGRYLKLAILA